jgi:hypothetical protein
MTRKFTKAETKLRRDGQMRAVLQLERAAAGWALDEPDYAARCAKEARERRKDASLSLLDINNQFDLYKRLLETHGAKEEEEFQRRSHKSGFAGRKSAAVRAAKAEDSHSAILCKAKLGRTRYPEFVSEGVGRRGRMLNQTDPQV